MAKKKKKKELDPSLMPFYLPGSMPIHIDASIIEPFKYNYSRTNVGGDLTAQAFFAFYEYTFGGPVEMMAAKSVTQGTIGFSIGAGGVYGTLGTAVGFELAMDFLILGVIATAIDPQHRWAGGLDETNWYKQNITEKGLLLPAEQQRNVWREIGYQ